MKEYLVRFLKNGELFESIVTVKSAYRAREIIAFEYGIPIKFEIGSGYENDRNHVGSVIELK